MVTFPVGTRIILQCMFSDAQGPVPIDGRPSYESSDVTVLVSPLDDGTSINPYLTQPSDPGAEGTVRLTVHGDGDPKPGDDHRRDVSGFIDITFEPGEPPPREAQFVAIGAVAAETESA